MKYSDLVKFEPIDSVIQLEQANSLAAVREHVQTFVISKRMAEQLCDLVIPNLQFATAADNKGVLIVGNYGTGKSHLLSLISGLAEHADMAKVVKDKDVAEASKAISGKFKVVRLEIPATKKSLRNIICGRLEDFMSNEGLAFNFPADDEVDSNKDDLSSMMAQFNAKYPDHGLLLVVDELLDYLRSRRQHDLILDLGFLREIGEVCKLIRFRFIAGLQESLFDNPKFQFVAESLRRVKDRFEQLRIVRQDVAYVVSERLLTKTDEQKAKIREHLEKFTPLYGGMAERLEEFVRLFPVHPTYLEVFEAISVAEKREVLKTLSAEIKRCFKDDVPQDQPGLISYDSYWDFLQGNAVMRSVPEIKDVIDVSKVVENRIQQAFTRKALQPMALRIIHGLSIHRLTTDDIRAKIGPTSEELQNGLCLMAPIPEKTSDFLRTTVEACLKEIMKTVSGQFITHNTENDQYYLDLQKTIDHDAKIQDKAETLSDSHLDQYYFEALIRVLELTDQTPYVRGYQIWEHEIEWREHKITRRGYLFFGAPNERSTAQPPRDFYLYFLQPFEPPHFEDQKLADEVFFKLTHRDKHFEDTLRLYAGAREMALSASTGTKKVYEDKADDFLKLLVAWLRNNMLTSFEVIHQGVPKKMVEWLKGHRTGNAAVRDLLELTGSVCLAISFEDRYPEYPTFTVKLSASNLKQPAEDVIRWLAGGVKNNLATAVLDGLELLDGDKLKPHQSRYAKVVLEKLEGKPPGQVVNRKELITVKNDVERECQYQLEPEFLLIVLASLVQNGNLTLSLAGKKLDAANLSEATKTPLEQLVAFKHVEKPKGLPLAELVAIFELLGLREGLIRNENTHDEAVKELRSKSNELTERVVTVTQHVQNGLPCWGSELIPSEERDQQLADVRVLDKQHKTYKQQVQGVVKADLIISAYKPSHELEARFKLDAGTENGAWEFVKNHLQQLPVFVEHSGRTEIIAERQNYLLFDRMVAFHVQRGVSIPLSSSDLYAGLRQRYPERDGMYFLPEQASEYDRKRLDVKEVEQYELIVSDEKSAIQWVRRQLVQKPTTYQNLQPIYMKEAQRVWEKHEQPLELRTILEQNFFEERNGTWRVPDPKKESDLEQLRHRTLMKEFQQYLATKGKLKVVRTEALRAGFKESWQKRDYTTIVQMAKWVPDAVIQEDQALLMYFDNALMRTGE